MKAKLILSSLLSFFFYLLSSQSPHGFNYQAVAMDAGGAVLVEQPLTARISILTASTGGTLIWEETHAVTTNKSGLISFVVGTGNRTGGSATLFSDISWSTQTLFLKTEIDPGSGYITMGTTQIWSVPYSLTAKNTETKQTLTLAGSDLSISGGNTVTLPSGSSLWTANGADIYRPGGNVGIGTNIPTNKLEVHGGNSQFTYNSGNSALSFTTAYGNSFMFKPLDHALQLQTDHIGNPSVMFIDKSGVIGLGTNTPEYRLDVLGRSRFQAGGGSAGFWLTNDANTENRSFIGMYTDDYVGFYGLGSGWGLIMNLGNGLVGIGRTPITKLTVEGSTTSVTTSGTNQSSGQFQAWAGGTAQGQNSVYSFYPTFDYPGFTDYVPRRAADIVGGYAGGVWGTEYMSFNVGLNGASNDAQYVTSEKMRITSAGNIGIGTSTPTSKLTVNPPATWSDEVPLFEVKNKSGIPVFAVYNNGVRILVDDNSATKGIKGGFAIGGFDNTKATLTGNLVTISPDSIRFNINNAATKGVKGGFGIGSYGTVKGVLNQDFMYITPQAGSSGLYNVTLGYLAGKNTTGAHNTLIGLKAGYGAAGNGSGGNIFIGEGAGMNNSGGYLTSNITLPDGTPIETITSWGGENVGIGLYCGKNLNGTISSRTGNYNVMVGNYSGTRLSTGYKNVLIGNYAGYKLETGHHNVFIGYDAGKEELGSNKLYIDNSSTTAPLIYGDFDINYVTVNGDFLITGAAYKPGGGSWSASSDVRLKDIHESFSLGLNEIVGLNPVYFNYKEGNARMHASDIEYVGFVAQDVQQLLPEAVSEGKDGYLNLDMHVINVALVNAVKEQQKQIESQNEKIARLERLVESLILEKTLTNEH